MTENEESNAIDAQVGSRIRMRRQLIGMSQEQLAAAVGVTFQQIQKYERGANRVSASRMVRIARALIVPAAFFFEGLDDGSSDTGQEETITAFLRSREGVALAAAWVRLVDGQRRCILNLVQTLADGAAEGAGADLRPGALTTS